MDDYSIGLRVLDIEHGFRETRPDAQIQGELANSLLLGKAANIALHLRGFNVISDLRGLRYVAAELGVGSTELTSVLYELEAMERVRLIRTGTQIKRVEVVVPALRDGFEVIGARWRDLQPTEIEQGSVAALADAVVRPYDEARLTTDLGMPRELAGTVLEIGEAGTYLRRHRLDTGEKVVYSPLYGDSNPEKALKVVQKYGDDKVRQLIERVRGEQGIPIGSLKDGGFANEAVLSGLVLAPAVRERQFVFTPQQGIVPEEAIILDKARAIVSCVRYGQHFADVTKIFSPRAIIDALIQRKGLKPHSEHLEQYGLLVKKGIGRVEQVLGNRWKFTINDTDDNMKALKVARDLLETGDGVHQQVDDEAKAKILNPKASYSTPVAQRVRLNKAVKTKNADLQTTRAISDLIRGAIGA
jgi:hypothetical protein